MLSLGSINTKLQIPLCLASLRPFALGDDVRERERERERRVGRWGVLKDPNSTPWISEEKAGMRSFSGGPTQVLGCKEERI